jgi:lysyl-tRNA synthetase class 2
MARTSLNDEHQLRLEKLAKLQERGLEVYPARTEKKQIISELSENFATYLEKETKVITAGRIRALRLHGKTCFLDLEDETGKIQAYFKEDVLGADHYTILSELLDVGDFIEITGKAFQTQKGQPTILVESFIPLAKTVRPIPESWSGLKDVETRFRKRHLDLLVNPDVKKIFYLRSAIITFIRRYFDDAGFMEVDTPILQTVAGGASAKPFITHHNALDMSLFLRVAPELYLKRLTIGGFEKVYEISRCFRNEGIDLQHNPEFTQIEFYWAYKDYRFLMKFMEEFFQKLIPKINNGSLKVKNGEDDLDFTGPYPVWDYREMILKHLNIDLDKANDADLLDYAQKEKLKVDKTWGRGHLIDELYKKRIRKNIIKPTFIINHPIELSPLAKKIADRPRYVERFQLVIKGAEICNAFSELNDPIDQAERFKEQQKLQEKGDDEAQGADQDFVEALEYGLPPTAGLGMGIDRLTMLLGDVENIKEVILFPTMKPK